MTPREQDLYHALKRITLYMNPSQLRKKAEKRYGVSPEEAIEMAYENVLAEARSALKGIRPPQKKEPTP